MSDIEASKERLTVIGESFIDIITSQTDPSPLMRPAGSPINVAVGAARLGLAVTFVTHYADDPHGNLIEKHLKFNNIKGINCGIGPTSTVVTALDPEGIADYSVSIRWDINGASLPAQAAIEESMHVHTGSLAAALPPGNNGTFALIEAAKERATISYDPDFRHSLTSNATTIRRQVELFVAASDVVRVREEDLDWLYPNRTPYKSLQSWLDYGPAVVVLTRGADGPVILSRKGYAAMPGEALPVTYPVGAGESFMAALISGLAQLEALGVKSRTRLYSLELPELHALAAYANQAAAITCSRPGLEPPHMFELGPLRIPPYGDKSGKPGEGGGMNFRPGLA
jgi:fructokinase